MSRNNRICTLNLEIDDAPRARALGCPTRLRLTQAFSQLQDIQFARNCRRDPLFGKSAEERIIWRELLELELQDVDEQIERVSVAAADSSGFQEERHGGTAISGSSRSGPLAGR